MSLIETADLWKTYEMGHEQVHALRGVSIQIERGEYVAIMGPSGSGKSTLLACLAGLDAPDGGRVCIDGEQMTRRPEGERAMLRARKIGMLYQSGNLIDHLSVEQNLALVRQLAGRVDRERVAELLGEVGLRDRATASPMTLSGGEAARAALAVALVNDPAVLFADEPTGELDVAATERVMELMRRQADAGTAVLLVTHNAAVAAAADREIHLRDGRIVP
jgi:putative ABC transport system ATP-binding protein